MILDKTGTITFGNRLAADFIPVKNSDKNDLIQCAALTSLHDDTLEGKSTLELARKMGDNHLTAATIAEEAGVDGFIAECKPEDKIDVIKKNRQKAK